MIPTSDDVRVVWRILGYEASPERAKSVAVALGVLLNGLGKVRAADLFGVWPADVDPWPDRGSRT